MPLRQVEVIQRRIEGSDLTRPELVNPTFQPGDRVVTKHSAETETPLTATVMRVSPFRLDGLDGVPPRSGGVYCELLGIQYDDEDFVRVEAADHFMLLES